MAQIKSWNSTDELSVDPISKAARVTLYNSDGVEGTKEVPVYIACSPVTWEDDDIISSIDVTEYKTISLQLTGTWVGTVTFQGSNDNGAFYDIVAQNTTSLTTPYSSTATVVGLWNIPVVYKYFRARVTTYTSGTFSGTAYGHKEDKALNSVGQIGEVTLASETTKVIGTVNVNPNSNTLTGSITAADTSVVAPANDWVLLSGVSSVNSYISINSTASESSWGAEITGTIGGTTFYFEGSSSSTDGIDGEWISIHGYQKGKHESNIIHAATTAWNFSWNIAGFSYFRIRAVGWVGINANVVIRLAAGTNTIHLGDSLPTGENVIGSIDNIAKIGGVAPSMWAGVVDAGTLRVTLPDTAPLSTDFYVTGVGAVDVNSRILRTGACILKAAVFTSYAATPRHIKLYDTATTPVAGVGTPVLVLTRASSGNNSYPLPEGWFPFVNGIGMTFVQGAANNNAVGTATVDGSLTSIFT